jgi:hypothetical protein
MSEGFSRGAIIPRRKLNAIRLSRKLGLSAFAFYFIFCALMRCSYFALYNVEVFESRDQRCEEWTILCKESRFLTTDFFAGADLVPHPCFFAPIQNIQITKNKTGI